MSNDDIKKAQDALNNAKVPTANRCGVADGKVVQYTDKFGNPMAESIQDQKVIVDELGIKHFLTSNGYNPPLVMPSKQDQKADEIDEILSDLEDYHRGYAKGIMPHEAKVQLLALKERWEREARINELQLADKKYFQPIKKVSWVDYFINRIAQLGGKE